MINQHLEHLKAGQISPNTIRLRAYYLNRAGRALDLLTASTADLERWIAGNDWSNETARSARSALVVFYTWLHEIGRREDNPAARLPRIKEKAPCPKPLPEMFYRNALNEADGIERLAMRLAGEAGLRRTEVAQIHARDIEPDIIGYSLRVKGKGGKIRRVPLSDSLAREVIRACNGGWAFPSPVSGSHLTAGCIAKKVSRFLPAGYSMHSLRHRFATTAYVATHDIRAVQELLGHSTLNTTQRYVAVDSNRLRNVALAAA